MQVLSIYMETCMFECFHVFGHTSCRHVFTPFTAHFTWIKVYWMCDWAEILNLGGRLAKVQLLIKHIQCFEYQYAAKHTTLIWTFERQSNSLSKVQDTWHTMHGTVFTVNRFIG